MRSAFIVAVVSIAAAGTNLAVQAVLTPAKDNTLFQDSIGGISNGAGDALFAGYTAGAARRRALMAFDLSSIPASATINGATLTLNVTKAGPGGSDLFSLYQVGQNWGEGTSSTSSGSGALAAGNDATWLHRFYNTSTWTAAGGDFAAGASASVTMGLTGVYALTGAQLAGDVQSWLAAPASNFGWLLKNSETISGVAMKITSRESFIASARPTLAIDYSVAPASSNWLGDVDGNWEDGAKWSAGVPDSAGAHAVLGPVIQVNRNIQLNSLRTVGTLTIDSPNSYTLSGNGTLHFDAAVSNVHLDVRQGEQIIQTPITTAAGKTLHKTGGGRVRIKPPNIDSLSVDAGTVELIASGATASLKTLSFNGGKLDLTDNTLRLDDGAASPIDAIRGALQSGSLITSNAGLPQTALAYRAISATRVDVTIQPAGDSNFDGHVNTVDFNLLAGSFGGINKYWIDGDYNYTGNVDSTDFNQFATNYGFSTITAAPPMPSSTFGNPVPEPSSLLGGMAISVAMLIRGRRRL